MKIPSIIEAEFVQRDRTLDKAVAVIEATSSQAALSTTLDDATLSATATVAGTGGLFADATVLHGTPESLILHGWGELETTIRSLMDQKQPNWLHDLPRQIGDAARRLGLTEDEITVLLEMQALRNQILHSDLPITRYDAARFKLVVDQLRQRLLNANSS